MKNQKKNRVTNKLPMGRKVRKGFAFYCSLILAITLLTAFAVPAFAATNDPLKVVNNLSDFIFGLIRAIGLILLGFGIVQIGLSLKSHDPSQRANTLTVLIIVVIGELATKHTISVQTHSNRWFYLN